MALPSIDYGLFLYKAANDNQRLLVLRKAINPADVFTRNPVVREFGRRAAARAGAAGAASALGPIGWIIDVGLIAWTVYDIYNYGVPGGGGEPDYGAWTPDMGFPWTVPDGWLYNPPNDPPGYWHPDGSGAQIGREDFPLSSGVYNRTATDPYVGLLQPSPGYHPWSYQSVEYGLSDGSDPAFNNVRALDGIFHVDGLEVPQWIGPETGGDPVVTAYPGVPIIGSPTNANFQRMEASRRDQAVRRYWEPGTGTRVDPGDPLERPGVSEEPWSRPNDPEVTRQVVVSPSPQPNVSIPTPPRPPRAGEKERKARSNSRSLGVWLARALDGLSEASEIVDAVYQALPADVRKRWDRPDRPGDQIGQYGLSGADWKLQALWHNWHRLDVGDAAKNILLNEIEDRLYGKYHKGLDRLTRRGQYRKANNV